MGARILVVDDSPTIRKVVAMILEARAFAPITAEDGQDALEKLATETVDLVLLDFVMPRMNGYQFCRELRANPELKNLPVVLMSAKGDKIRGQFVQQTGAVDAITKPFDARGLVAVIEGALKKHEEGRARPVPDADAMPDEETIAESIRPSSISSTRDPNYRRARAAADFAGALAEVVMPEIRRIAEIPASAYEQFLPAISRAITADRMPELTARLRIYDFGGGTNDALAGDIAVISIAEILQLLQLQRQTGVLLIANKKSEITLYVREGQVDFAASHGLRDEFLLGRYFVEDGTIDRDELEKVVQSSAPGKMLGETLAEMGLASEDRIKSALERQTSELVYEVVRWKTGRFVFTAGAADVVAAHSKLGLSIGGLVMEGFRRVDEWRLIEGSFDFDEVLYRDDLAIERMGQDSELTKLEAAVLERIDGERTVREIVDDVEGSSFELSKILYQFLNSRLVRRKAA